MFYVYVLQSKKDTKLYIGSTNNLEKRFKKHNDGEIFSTKSRRPFELIYYEAFLSEKDAREREKQLKHFGKAYQELKKRIENSIKGAGFIKNVV